PAAGAARHRVHAASVFLPPRVRVRARRDRRVPAPLRQGVLVREVRTLFLTQDFPPDHGGIARLYGELCARFPAGGVEVSTVRARVPGGGGGESAAGVAVQAPSDATAPGARSGAPAL